MTELLLAIWLVIGGGRVVGQAETSDGGCSTSGCTMSGDIDVNGYDLLNVDDMICSQGSGDCVYYDDNGMSGCSRTTDALPNNVYAMAQSSYAVATGANQTGADLVLAPGIGTRTVTIDDYNNCAGDTVTVTINGTPNVLTEGVSWTAATDNDTTAASLAAAVHALSGVSATSAAAVVLLQKDQLTRTVTLAESDATCTTLLQGANGDVAATGHISMNTNRVVLDADEDTYINSDVDDTMRFRAGAGLILTLTTGNVRPSVNLNMNGYYIYDGTGPVLVTGDVSMLTAAAKISTLSRIVDVVIPAGHASLGSTAPQWGINDSCAGLAFAADAEYVTLIYEVPNCWDSTSDLTLRTYWCPESGDAPQLNETVKWDARWRSIIWGTEDVDNGTIATGTVTYTEPSNPGDDKDSIISTITIPRTGGNQPLAAGDIILIQFDRDVSTDTYSGTPIVALWEIRTYRTSLMCDHE